MLVENLGEFSLIDRFTRNLNQTIPKNIIGIGDDCAVISNVSQRDMLVTSDMLIEGIHFLKASSTPKNIGYKALAASLSDIAAMGGTPQFAFLSMAIPSNIEVDWVDQFFIGLQTLAQKYGVLLLGGDTSESPRDISVSVTVIGSLNSNVAKLRSSARDKDILCVTGPLGDSACGLRILQGELSDFSNEKSLKTIDANFLLHCYHHPDPQVEIGQWVGAKPEVHAMIDISDGLCADLKHIVNSSMCGATINIETIPISPSMLKYCNDQKWDPYEFAIGGGEDYQLLFSVDAPSYKDFSTQYEKEFGQKIFPIGELNKHSVGIQWQLNSVPYTLNQKGYEHFTH